MTSYVQRLVTLVTEAHHSEDLTEAAASFVRGVLDNRKDLRAMPPIQKLFGGAVRRNRRLSEDCWLTPQDLSKWRRSSASYARPWARSVDHWYSNWPWVCCMLVSSDVDREIRRVKTGRRPLLSILRAVRRCLLPFRDLLSSYHYADCESSDVYIRFAVPRTVQVPDIERVGTAAVGTASVHALRMRTSYNYKASVELLDEHGRDVSRRWSAAVVTAVMLKDQEEWLLDVINQKIAETVTHAKEIKDCVQGVKTELAPFLIEEKL